MYTLIVICIWFSFTAWLLYCNNETHRTRIALIDAVAKNGDIDYFKDLESVSYYHHFFFLVISKDPMQFYSPRLQDLPLER